LARRSRRKTSFLEGLLAVYIAGVVLVALLLNLGLEVSIDSSVRLAGVGVAALLAVHVLSVGIAKANARFAPRRRSTSRRSSSGSSRQGSSSKRHRVPRGLVRRIDRRSGKRIRKHAAELSVARSRCFRGDGRGIVDQDKWRREQDEFIDKHLLDDVEERHAKALKRRTGLINAWRRRMDAAVNDYENSRANVHGVDFRPGMDGFEYEAYCARLLAEHGWKVWNKGDTGDQGVDLIAEKRGTTLAIQCKRYRGSVGNSAVQEIFAGRLTVSGTAKSAVVSNASYTRSAKELADATGVLLLHHDELCHLDEILNGSAAPLAEAA
jgi:restriction system protein